MSDLAGLLTTQGASIEAEDDFEAINRLYLVNIGGAIPALGDMSTFGSPAKYSYCVAENEAESPWEPLHVERGFPAEASTVTVVGAECPHNVNDHESLTAVGILTTFAGTMLNAGSNDVCYEAQPVAVFGPEHANSAFIPTFGATRSVTRALTRRDGQFASSVEELRKKV